MIIRGVKKEDCIVRGANSPKQCRVHAKSLIELQKHLKDINYVNNQQTEQPQNNESTQAPDIKKITRQFSHSFFNTKNRNSSSSRLKTDDGRQTIHNTSQQSNALNSKFIPFVKERDQLGRLLTDNYDAEDDATVFTYRPNSYRKHAKSTDIMRLKTQPSKSGQNDVLNKNAIIQLRMSGLFKEKKAEEQLSRNKIEEMIESYQLDNKILLGANKQNSYEVQPLDSLNNNIQMVNYRLNIKHQEDLQRNQLIANNLTFARGFYKRAQADEQYRRVKTNHSNHQADTRHTEGNQPDDNNDFHNKFQKNKNYYLNLRKQLGQNLNDQLKIFKKRNQDIQSNPIPPLGFYDATTSQENCVLKQQPKVIFNKQERFMKDNRDEEYQRISPQRPPSIMKKRSNENIQNQNVNTNNQTKQVQIEGSAQKLKNVSDSSVAQIDQVNPKVFEQIREQEERRFRIEKNIDQIALDFNSEKASTLFTQNFLQTKQKLRRIKNNLNNMEYDTITFFEQVIQKQQKNKLDEGLS